MSRIKLIGLCLLSGILLAIPWYESLPNLTLFFGFVPLLLAHDELLRNRSKGRTVVFYSSLTFMSWVGLSAWWVYNATFFGAIMTVIIPTVLMAPTFLAYHYTRKIGGDRIGLFSFIVYWIAFEFFFHNSEIQWPWMTLGNGIGDSVKIIQWYEYTGVLGGSLWIIVINLLVYIIYKRIAGKLFKKLVLPSSILAAVTIIPIAISFVINSNYREKENPAHVVIVQPSINPYNEKFSGLSNDKQMDIMFNLADQNIDSNTDYVVCPETAIDDNIWEESISSNSSIARIKNFTSNHPKIKWISGLTSLKLYKIGDELSVTARAFSNNRGYYYDYYNSAIQIDTTNNYPIYHKSKLVVGVEMMPYPKQLKILEKLSVNLGGITGSLGSQPDRGVFFSPDRTFGVGPVICFESDFGEFMTGYVKNGANLIFVITNDGWWGDTPGHQMHLTLSRIRAIELRRSIARSANTGISAIINQKGELIDTLGWYKRSVLKGTVNANNEMTFYTRNGDYIGRFAYYLGFFMMLYTIIRRFAKRKNKP
jgi:apolipoprotein N-acyltransferase